MNREWLKKLKGTSKSLSSVKSKIRAGDIVAEVESLEDIVESQNQKADKFLIVLRLSKYFEKYKNT